MPQSKRIQAAVVLPILLIVALLSAQAVGGAQTNPNSRLFPETGKTVRGRFLEYWNANGGLAQQGFPVTEEFSERSDTDGKLYTVQYFERAVFEAHPENQRPYDVLLSLLGNSRYKARYPSGAPGQTPNTAAGSVLFRETSKRVGGRFLEYWNRNGGLAQQGFPISDEFQERSETDGKTYLVQYFERAVFEYHPENAGKTGEVLLSLLGNFYLKQRYPSGAPATTPLPTAVVYATPTLQPLTLAQRLDVFERVWRTVRDNYVYTDYRGLNWQAVHDEYEAKIRAAASEAAVYDLIAEMIDKLGDNHSGFLNPQQVAEDEAMKRGELRLSGIGVLTQDIGEAIRIVYVVPGGPASKAGLKPFDIIRAADGELLTRSEDAPRLIRGPAGTTVRLTIETPGRAPREVAIVREVVNFVLKVEASRWPGTNVAYVTIPTFAQFGVSDEVASELRRLLSAGPLDGVIIDVRQNSGGYLIEEHETLGLFINGGNAGYEVTRRGRTEDRIPAGQTIRELTGKPIVVLTSGGTVSAAERFAAVMQDYKRATILGTKTAGNTETVYPYDLTFGSRLMLAQATYLRTDGKTSFEDVGVTPDVVLDVKWYEFAPENDPQILDAVRRIQGR
jgi:carboxyl-terminal processing protease